jgi:Periplasmic binding protein
MAPVPYRAGPRPRALAAAGAATKAVRTAAVLLLVMAAALVPGRIDPAAATEAETDVEPDYVKVGYFVSSDANRCFSPGLVTAIRYFSTQLAARINDKGGIAGKRVDLVFYDDFEQAEAAVATVGAAIDDPRMLAMIGVPSSTRGQAIFSALGNRIRRQAIPFITEISLDSLFRDAPNVFTMASSVGNELDVVRKVISDDGYQRPVFVGLGEDLYSKALGDGLADAASGPRLAAQLDAPVRDYKLDEEAAASMAADIAGRDPDLILLAIHSGPSSTLIKKLAEAGVSAPIFVLLGRVQNIANVIGVNGYGGAMMEIAREGVPNVYSERLRQRIWHSPGDTWVFPDVANADTAGWKDGTCDNRGEVAARQVFDAANKRAVGRGTQYRDMLQLIAEAARTAPKYATMAELRRHVGEELRGFVEGRRVLKGLWQDWTFTRDRTAAGDNLVLEKPAGEEVIALAPMQHRRINGSLQRSPTVYTSIDLISLSRIDTNDRSFDAQFYLSMRSPDRTIGIDSIEFTNAYRSPTASGHLVTTHEINDGLSVSDFPSGVKLYKVSGKFEFEPELGDYPFDTQRLSVSFQPASAAHPFLIQPAAATGDLADVPVDGWQLKDRYVGSDQDIVPTLGTALGEKRIVPFYKFNATWVVKRHAVDYYLRVVVPLAFILLVTYFSVYLPHARFDSIMAIQVTALLSSIALYLALPKVDSDQATFSDKLFMLTYAGVSLMIGLSILKDNMRKTPHRPIIWSVVFLQLIAFPIATVVFVMYLLPASKGEAGQISSDFAAVWQSIFG